MKPVSRVLAFKIWLSIALSIFLAVCANFLLEIGEEGANRAEEVLIGETVASRRIEDRINLDMRRVKQTSQVLISDMPTLEESSTIEQKLLGWVSLKNDKELNALGVKIVYVGDKNHYIQVLDNNQDEADKKYLFDRYAEWMDNAAGDFFYWQIQFSDYPNLLNVHAVLEQQALNGDVFHVIVRYETPMELTAYKHSNEKIIFFDNNNIALTIRNNQFMPVLLSYEKIDGIDNSVESIKNKLGYSPDLSLVLEVFEAGGIEYHRFKGEESLYLAKLYELTANNWKILILFNAEAITEGMEEELMEGLQAILGTLAVLLILTMLLYYHYKVRSLIYIDPLTKLYNRGHFKENINTLIELHDRGKISNLGVIAIDIDKFKSINDEYGHAVGDKVLKALAKLMRQTTRRSEWVYRFGGEEFIILCSGETLESMTKLAERLRGSVEQQVATKEYLPKGFTISLGVAEKRGGESIDKVLTRADDLLYKAKENGRNQVQV